MRKLALLVGMALLAPTGLAAQVCLGYPATRAQSDLGAVVRLQSARTQVGGTYSADYSSDVVADALLTYDHFSKNGVHSNGWTAGARLGLELHSAVLPAALSLCPHAGLTLGRMFGDNTLTIPVGFGIGTVVPLESSAASSRPGQAPRSSNRGLLIFATPEVAYQHVKGNSDTFALSEFGARYLVGRFYAGASVIVASGGRDAVLGLNVGIPLP